jgi:hypothetical protein
VDEAQDANIGADLLEITDEKILMFVADGDGAPQLVTN